MQFDVEVARSDRATLHRCQHLYLFRRITVFLWKTVAHKSDDEFYHFIGIFLIYEEEIGVETILDIGKFTCIDGVGVHHNSARLSLTEDAGEPYNRNLL